MWKVPVLRVSKELSPMIVSICVNRIRKVVVERLMADNSVGQLFIRLLLFCLLLPLITIVLLQIFALSLQVLRLVVVHK